ncbi:PEP-CTERM sorting domain-containing protein [Rheinheimera sp.]|uniref:PEP-CTERM sorting domain-containing protein n=1 Tax=Rheinheimera TaxID=67575 RepID=UPI002357AB6A|nr:PEP-CTERM sorting domain-containing protein [Rheinheimera sp.]
MKLLKTILCATGLMVSSAAMAGPILIINGANQTTEPGTTSALTDNLKTLHEAVGNTVTIVDDLLGDLSSYAQVWDVRFFNAAALDSVDQTAYSNYLVNGGGLFLMGENSSFMERNNSVLSLISSLGGGDLGYNDCYDGTQMVHAPFTGPNDVTEVTYAASGCFNNKGSGQWITSRADGSVGSGVAFAAGSLANAMAGALTTILDVNFMMNDFDLPNSQQLTKNLIAFVGEQTENPSNPVPAPASVLILATGLAALRLRRR